jgi:hypothetical protein
MRHVACLLLLFGVVAISKAQCILHYPELASFQYTPGFYGRAPQKMLPDDIIFGVGMRWDLSHADHSYIDPQRGYLAGRRMWSDWYDHSGLGSREPAIKHVFNLLVKYHIQAHHYQFSMLYLQPKHYQANPRKVELEADLIGAYAYGALHFAERSYLNHQIDGRPANPRLDVQELKSYYNSFPDFMNTQYHSVVDKRLEVIALGLNAGLEGRFGPTLENFKLGYPGYLWMKEVVAEHLKS